MMKRLPLLFAATLMAAVVSGCRGCGRPADTATTPAAPAADGPVAAAVAATPSEAAPKPVPSVLPPVVARVNGEEVTRADLERSIRGVETQLKQRVPGDKRDGVIRGVLERLINYRLLLQEARTRGIEISPDEVDAQLAALARQFPTEEALRQALITRGVTVEMLRDDARRDLRVAKLVSLEAGQEVAVSADDVRAFYDANQERFRQPESIRAAHVFVRVPDGAEDKAKNAMRVRAEAILRLARRGDDFTELAKNYSEDRATGVNGGDLGWFNKGATPEPFDSAVFALQQGELAGPIETSDGFHIVKVLGRRPARIQPFEEVQADLATYLLRELQDRLTVKLINSLREKATIEILF